MGLMKREATRLMLAGIDRPLPEPAQEEKPGPSGKSYLLAMADAIRLPLPGKSVDLVFGSPPYIDARTYGIGAKRKCAAWVKWMLDVTTECQRVSAGPVVWVAAGGHRGRNYQPACEGLMWEWWRRGGDCQLYRPCIWHRIGIPGSGQDDWFRADTEYVMCFKRRGPLPWSDNTAMGHIPKWAPGGEMSHRLSSGTRRNQWGGGEKSGGHRTTNGGITKYVRPSHRMHTKRDANGNMQSQAYDSPDLANPGNLIKTKVGGGHLGHNLAHENEAPFPEALARFFVISLCRPGGLILDPFSGSGTTASVAVRNGRRALGFDIRQNQCELGERRISDQLCQQGRPHAKDGASTIRPLPGQLELFSESA